MGWSNNIEVTTNGRVRFDGIDELVNRLDYPYVVNGSVLFRDNGDGGLEVLDLAELDEGDEPSYTDWGGTTINRGELDKAGLKAIADRLVSGRIVIKQQSDDESAAPTLFVVEPGRVAEIRIGDLTKNLAEHGLDGLTRIVEPSNTADGKLPFPAGPML
jgi:hypothetical protein